MRILVIEDDSAISAAISTALRLDGYAVDAVVDLRGAEHLLAVNSYSVVVADRSVPDGDAADLVSDLRSLGSTVAVIFLTARDAVADRVRGFEVGGDDYLVKPFAMKELVVRVRALGRRVAMIGPTALMIGDLEIDRSRAEVRRRGVLLPLTPKERCILARLGASPDAVVSRSELIEHCWDDNHDPMSNVVDAHIKSLRRKLGPPCPIQTVRGSGFMLQTAQVV